MGHASQGALQGRQPIETRGVRDSQTLEQLQSQLGLESIKKFQALPMEEERERCQPHSKVTGLKAETAGRGLLHVPAKY